MKNIFFIAISFCLFFSCQNPPNPNSTNTNADATSPSSEKTSNQATTLQAPKLASKSIKDVEGIDISEYQSNINWIQVKEDNIEFVFIKATGGETYVDPSFKKHWSNVKKAEILHGAYHFYYTKDDPTTQANFFISNVLPVSEKTDLPPVVDIESGGVNSNITPEQLQKDIQIFLALVQSKFDRKPILYTSFDFAQKYFNNPAFDQYYLWIAEYDSDSPIIPFGWNKTGWTFWQNSPSATIKGIENEVDHDFFNGSLAQLNEL